MPVKNKQPSKPIQARIEHELNELVEKYAAARHIKASQVVREALWKLLDPYGRVKG